MAYEKNVWGTYEYDDSKTLAENIEAAELADAVVTKAKLDNIENGIAEKAAKGDKGDKGAKGDTGAAGAKGDTGASVKAIDLTTDADGKVTGGTATLSDDSTVEITVTAAE